MAIERLEVEIDLNTGQVVGQLSKVEKSGKKSGKGLEKSFGNAFKKIALQAAGVLVVFKGLQKLAGSVKGIFSDGISAAIVQEDSINKLNVALAQSGQFTQSASEDFQKFASSIQESTKFGDEAILSTAALIQSLGKLSTDGLKQATQATVDLSAALGIGLTSAATLVGKAAAGNVSSFSRYGVVIKTGANATETFNNALVALNKSFGGTAAGQVNTYSGAQQQLANSFGDFQEAIGRLITTSPALVATFKVLTIQFAKLTSDLDGFRKEEDFLKPLILEFIDFSIGVNDYLIKPVILFKNVAVSIFNGVLLFIRQRIQEVLGVFSFVFDKLAEKFDAFNGTANFFKDNFDANSAALRENLTDLKTNFEDTAKSFDNTFGEESNSKFSNFMETIRSEIAKANPVVAAFKNNIVGAAEGTKEKIIDVSSAISGAFKQGAVSVIVEGMTRIGRSLNQGKGAFAGFADAVLNIIGDMAISIGSTLIGIGIGIEKLKLSLFKLTGGEAIAAGLALVAIGGLLKSLSSGGGSSGAAGKSGSSGSSGVASSSFEDPISEPDSIDREKKTSVQLTVQGDVLDSDETGTRIVRLLNDAFENRGTVLTGAKFA